MTVHTAHVMQWGLLAFLGFDTCALAQAAPAAGTSDTPELAVSAQAEISVSALSAEPAQSAATPATAAPVEVVVRGARPSQDVLSLQFNASDSRRMAGTQGDPVKVVENVPGVAHTSFGATPPVLWGAAPQDTRYFVDGVEIPRLFHGGGIRSTFNGEWLKDITVTPAAYGTPMGRGIGGVVSLTTKSLPFEGSYGYLDVNTLDASAKVSSTLGQSVRFGVAGRYGWFDRVFPLFASEDTRSLYSVPRYHDAQARLEIDLRPEEGLEVVALESHDDSTYALHQNLAANGFKRLYVRYHRILSDRSQIEIVPWIGVDDDSSDERFAGTSVAELRQTAFRWGARASQRARLNQSVSWEMGCDTAASDASINRVGSMTVPAREGDLSVFGQPPVDNVNADHWNAGYLSVAPYAQFNIVRGPWTVTPGFRLSGYLLDASRLTPRIGSTPAIGYSDLFLKIEPRIQTAWRMSSRVKWVAAAGRYSQAPDPADMSAVFGSPRANPATSTHLTAGEVVDLTGSLSLSVTGFYKHLEGLAVRDTTPTPKLAQALLSDGTGRAYGVQFWLRQRPWNGYYGWLGGTISRSERKDAAATGWRLFDFDEPLLLTFLAGKRVGKWGTSLRFRFASGMPRTPVTGAFFVYNSGNYQPILGPQNSIRLPDFAQLDIRVERTLDLGEATHVLVYGEVLNLLNRQNGEEFFYDSTYQTRSTISGLPLVAVLGARIDL